MPAYNNEIIGYAALSQVGGNHIVKDWTCAKYYGPAVAYHVYAGSAFLDGGSANLPAEAAVAASYETNSTAYRFEFPSSAAAGQSIE